MNMRHSFDQQRLVPMLCLFALLLAVLIALSSATENSARFSQLYSWLLLASALGLFLLTVFIAASLRDLLHSYRERAPGSRLTVKLVLTFVSLSALPVIVVFYFSMQFLQRGIESWFDVRIESALEDSLELSRSALDLRMREVLRQTERMTDSLGGIDEREMAPRLGAILAASDAYELTVFARSGRIIATAGSDLGMIVPNHPSEVMLLETEQGSPYVALEPIGEGGLHIRVVARIYAHQAIGEDTVFQALYPVPTRLSDLADSVRLAYGEYNELVYLRDPLKTSFILALSLVLLFGVLSAFWVALYAARQLVAPVRDLATGVRAVAAGQFDRQLPSPGKDELGFLVHSFNQMTRNLAFARDQAEQSQQIVERQRAFLETVLSRLSSGVITLDQHGWLTTHNTAASQILGVDLEQVKVAGTHPVHLDQFFSAIDTQLRGNDQDWREEITLFSQTGRQVLICRGSPLTDSADIESGYVLVFDDVTALVRAQRDAAWKGVARRLAHEVKNPLTPIQLAAERIRYKFLDKIDPEVGKVLDRSTHTIIQQVRALKEMVNSFNDYAKPSALEIAPLSLNELITEVLYMYKGHPSGVQLRLDLDPSDPRIEADRGRLRQVIHNLATNAIEARKDGCGHLWVSSRFQPSEPPQNGGSVTLVFADDGPGFPTEQLGDPFEPYVTSKPRGTGLGLAIVKKIVEDHGGVIELGSRQQGGAQVTVRLPVAIEQTPMIDNAAFKQEVG